MWSDRAGDLLATLKGSPSYRCNNVTPRRQSTTPIARSTVIGSRNTAAPRGTRMAATSALAITDVVLTGHAPRYASRNPSSMSSAPRPTAAIVGCQYEPNCSATGPGFSTAYVSTLPASAVA